MSDMRKGAALNDVESGVTGGQLDESAYDVAVVGGGMVGATLALALADSSLRVLVLERQALPVSVGSADLESFDPRVSALTLASEQLFRHLKVWPAMQARRVSPYRSMQVWDGEGCGSISFSAAQMHREHLGHIVENSVILESLQAQVRSRKQVDWWAPAEVADLGEPEVVAGEEYSARLLRLKDGRRVRARLVVAADGALSPTRAIAGFPMWEWDYGHHALVTTVRTAQPHQLTAWQCFTASGPLAFLPLPDPYCSSIVWSTDPDHARQLLTLSAEAFASELEREFEGRLGRIEAVARRQSFPLRQRHARYYVKQGMALVGDAAHTIHPLAGQGVNLGLLDAACLAEELLSAAARGEDFADLAVLRRFQRRRQSANLLMSAAMEGFKRLFSPQPPLLHWLRNRGMDLADGFGPLKREFARYAMGLEGALPASARPDPV